MSCGCSAGCGRRSPGCHPNHGSGADGRPRIDQTTQLLDGVLDWPALYGMASDRDVYRAILEQDLDYFLALSNRLADELCEHRIECVAGDSIEGYNPTHDLCGLLIDRAVRLASGRMGVAIRHYTFPLVGAPRPDLLSADSQCLRLTPDELVRKLAIFGIRAVCRRSAPPRSTTCCSASANKRSLKRCSTARYRGRALCIRRRETLLRDLWRATGHGRQVSLRDSLSRAHRTDRPRPDQQSIPVRKGQSAHPAHQQHAWRTERVGTVCSRSRAGADAQRPFPRRLQHRARRCCRRAP